ncbi:MAG: guanylate kinase, partial [Clostridia bacterium]|nr:guanylate kinase [Clostridia bacterium]
ILPPDFETLKARLLGRGSETPEQAEKRLKDAKTQLGYAYAYDFVVVNDDLDTAVAQVKGIIAACTHRANNCKLLIDSINHAF